jgi:hypothetical protein
MKAELTSGGGSKRSNRRKDEMASVKFISGSFVNE